MATIYTHKDRNVRRTWFLMAAFLVFVVAVGWFISYYYGEPSILYAAITFSLFMNVLSYWYSDKIALALAGAKQVSRKQYQELFRSVENLCITAGLPLPRIFIIDD